MSSSSLERRRRSGSTAWLHSFVESAKIVLDSYLVGYDEIKLRLYVPTQRYRMVTCPFADHHEAVL
jgi:hypothetical protein